MSETNQHDPRTCPHCARLRHPAGARIRRALVTALPAARKGDDR